MSKLLSLFRTDEEKKSFVTTFNDPFKAENVTSITMTIEKSYWTNNVTKYKACVYFKSGKTSGNHDLEADDFSSLVKLVEEFIKSLK